jgi:GTP-binding protein
MERPQEQRSTGLPVVAIVGRPNVGKSALFNRILGERRSIVDPQPGLTRDRLYGEAEWRGRRFILVDTAGLVLAGARDEVPSERELRRRMEEQTRLAIAEADAILFMVDVHDGLTPVDREIADLLRRSPTPVVLVANKVDNRGRETAVHEFWELGIGEPRPVSALHGTGSGDLLDAILAHLPESLPVSEEAFDARVAILGRPNVGKSSLLNALLGDERSLVTATPGTTRDPVDTRVDYQERRALLIDTAGIRRPGLTRGVEQYSLLRGLRAMERADVALVLIDASEGITAQDQHIAGYVVEAGRGLVLVVNKWDLLPVEGKRSASHPGHRSPTSRRRPGSGSVSRSNWR